MLLPFARSSRVVTRTRYREHFKNKQKKETLVSSIHSLRKEGYSEIGKETQAALYGALRKYAQAESGAPRHANVRVVYSQTNQ